MNRDAARWVVVMMAIALAGCGWQLRGAAGGGLDGTPIALEGRVGNRITAEVAQSLRGLGAEVVPSAGAARLVVQVDAADTQRRTVATGTDGFATEYELTYALSFSTVPGGRAEPNAQASSSQTVEVSRAFALESLQAADAEQEALTRDLRSEAIQLMLTRVGRRL
ncbi:MAG: LPS assembly lipoprotein LptE [Spiribacter sp.]|nr:LPS assembly lipoprotein LptE [Spiribacter sp.]